MALYNSTKSPPPRQSVSLYWLGGGLSNHPISLLRFKKHNILSGVLKGAMPPSGKSAAATCAVRGSEGPESRFQCSYRAVSVQFSKKNCSTNTPVISGIFINVEQLEQFFGSDSAFLYRIPGGRLRKRSAGKKPGIP